MTMESEIYDSKATNVVAESGFYDFKLLKTTAYATLYRTSKAGKYFLVKTTKDNSERQQAMLRREYELSIGCDHSNIVHVFTFEDNMPVGAGIVMEYIEGRTLAEYLGENPSKADRCRLFEELLSAVGYLHKRGVIHNDLKPENILISRADNTLKLIDFGLADNDAQFAMRTLGCTPQYASPELQVQSSTIDARSDIYSVGVLMGCIFGDKHRRIVGRCMRRNPEERFENISALQRAWKNRKQPLFISLTLGLGVLFVLPLILLGRGEVAERRDIRAREALFAQIESDVDRLYELAADSIAGARFLEFADNHIVSFWEALTAYQNEHIATIADAELNALANNVYAQRVSRCHTALWELANVLPILYKSNLTPEELQFYMELVGTRQPYRPYCAE